jgi:tetratricopeptide (TPR) repeat protein/TolB-like protein
VILSGAAALFYFVPGTSRNADSPLPTLLVYAGEYLPTDSAGEYYSYAIAEELIHHLAPVHGLRVIAPGTMAALRYGPPDSSVMATGRSVRYSLKWFFATRRGSVALDLILSDSSSADPLWMTHMESAFGEAPAMIRTIADSVAMLTGGVYEHGAGDNVSRTVRGDAYPWYLYGRFILARQGVFNLGDAVLAFQRSLQDDPDHPATHAALAWTLLLDYEAKTGLAPYNVDGALVQVKEAQALKAMNPEIMRVFGMVAQYQSDYDAAIRDLEEAVSIGPNDAESHRRLATLYAIRGRRGDAVAAAQTGVQLDPWNSTSYMWLGQVYELSRDLQAAADAYRQGGKVSRDSTVFQAELMPEVLAALGQQDRAEHLLRAVLQEKPKDYVLYYRLGRLLQKLSGRKAECDSALALAQRILEDRLHVLPNDGLALAYLTLIHVRTGNTPAADSVRANVVARAEHDLLLSYLLARSYALEGDVVAAAEYLARSIERRYDVRQVLDADFDAIRERPEFQTAVRR